MATRARSRATPTALVPAASRTAASGEAALSEPEALLSAQAIDTFVKAVGGREQLIDVLTVSTAAPEIDRVVTYLLDPRYTHWSLRKLCRLAGITVADLFGAYKKAVIARAHVQAAHIIASRLPPIVEDVMNRAAPVPIVCPACHGEADRRETCPVCRGTGASLSEPELERQKLALELGHLTERKGGLIVQQNTGVITGPTLVAHGSGALEQLQQAVGELLHPGLGGPNGGFSDPPIEAAPILDPDPDPGPMGAPDRGEDPPDDDDTDADDADDDDNPDDDDDEERDDAPGA